MRKQEKNDDFKRIKEIAKKYFIFFKKSIDKIKKM